MNERLVAAAPDLLSLLKEWRDTPFFDDQDDGEAWIADFGKRVDEAISKATGQ